MLSATDEDLHTVTLSWQPPDVTNGILRAYSVSYHGHEPSDPQVVFIVSRCCVCMCLCVCVLVCTCVWVSVCKHVRLCTSMYMCLCVYVLVCACLCVCVHAHGCLLQFTCCANCDDAIIFCTTIIFLKFYFHAFLFIYILKLALASTKIYEA